MALRTPGWAESFDTGGALLDIVVSGMTPADWRAILAYHEAHPEVWTPCAGFQRAERMAAGRMSRVVTLHGLMRELGQLVRRDVAMSCEGLREAVVFRYQYATGSIGDLT